jgi:predicted lipoprotein with Yx(FWY)xxD motif
VRHPFALGASALSGAVLLAGCGSSGSSATKTAAAPAASAAAQSTPAATGAGSTQTAALMIDTKHAKLGTILAAGPKRRTVYLFEADKGAASTCAGACAQVWPPVSTAGEPKVAGGASAANLGTITRTDGTKQVTYKGHPLYFFARDGDQSDTYGQGVKSFGADWYVLAPSGKKVDKS